MRYNDRDGYNNNVQMTPDTGFFPVPGVFLKKHGGQHRMEIEKTREYFRSMVSQRGIKQTFFRGEPEYNASWDYNVSPEGRHFFSVCAEGPKIDAMVYEYLPETCEMKKCVDTKTDIITYPRTIRPSKVHTCMSFMEDGRIIMNNHTTAAAPGHLHWMPEAYFSHPWEGFPGSNVFIYDPKTGKTEDLGIPVPHESIYGGCYDPIHRAYYFSGHFRGHGYRLDLDTRKVTDYGQFVEFCVYFHLKGPDGNIYLSTARGQMLRYNVYTQQAEHLKASVPIDRDVRESFGHNVMAYGAVGPDKRIWLCAHRNEKIYAYDVYKDEMETVGSPVPEWYRDKYKGKYMLFGMDFDSEGILWYGLKILGNCMRLVSWDVLHGGQPVDHGIVGTPEHAAWNFCQIHIVNDVLYGSTTNHATDGPAMIAIDLKVMKEDVNKPRVRALDRIVYRGTTDADIYPTGEKIEGPAGPDATEAVAVKTIPGGHALSNGVFRSKPYRNQWYFSAGKHYATKLWQVLGIENSGVVEVFHERNGNTVAISGSPEGGYFRSVICRGKLLRWEKLESYTPKDSSAISKKYRDVILPAPAGRAWIADAECEAELADGSMLVGCRSGGLAIVKDGKSFSLGMVSTTGGIHDLAASPDHRTVYGVCGDPDEYGFIFSYNMDFGVACHGMIYFEEADSEDGLGISCEPCCIDYAPDGASISVGVRDRLGAVYEYYFEDRESNG